MKKNTFSKITGSVYTCDSCGRQTRNTGAQSITSKTCPQCYELAGIENEISDGHMTQEEAQPQIDELKRVIIAKGGKI